MSEIFTSAAELTKSMERVARAERLTVALDFDGTLAPLVDDPEASRALPASLEAMERLVADPSVTLALVSGRSLDSLDVVAPLTQAAFRIGSHGAEWRRSAAIAGKSETDGDAAEQTDAALRAASDPLRAVLAEIALDGARLEQKPYGVVVHTRGLDEQTAAEVQQRARDAVLSLADAPQVRTGKDVLDFTVAATGKDHAIRRLRDESKADAIIFIGDDVTDEDGFAALDETDLGVKVGEGPTLASVRIPDPDAVAKFLSQLAEVRAETGMRR